MSRAWGGRVTPWGKVPVCTYRTSKSPTGTFLARCHRFLAARPRLPEAGRLTPPPSAPHAQASPATLHPWLAAAPRSRVHAPCLPARAHLPPHEDARPQAAVRRTERRARATLEGHTSGTRGRHGAAPPRALVAAHIEHGDVNIADPPRAPPIAAFFCPTARQQNNRAKRPCKMTVRSALHNGAQNS